MKQINCSVSGRMTDAPVLRADNGTIAVTVVESPTRVIFELPDHVMGGATILYGGKDARVLLPLSGSTEGPELVYGPSAPSLSVEGVQFVANGHPWTWIGCTDFRLPHRLMEGEDIAPVLADRAGFTILRSLAMKADNIGWELHPRRPDYWDGVQRYFEAVGNAGFALEWTVFADTKALMPDLREQQAFWHLTCDLARNYPFVLLELVNECGHPTQALDPARFPKPTGIISSHGSGGTDADVVRPTWDYAAYHARRMQHPHDSRGASNYSPYIYQEDWPKPCPFIADEGVKPHEYGCSPEYARLIGMHARCMGGGTFHSNEGMQSVVFPEPVKACARAFCEALS